MTVPGETSDEDGSDEDGSDEDGSDEGGHQSASPRAADRLGDLLPDLTRDETAVGWGDEAEDADSDGRLRRDVPPHHGG